MSTTYDWRRDYVVCEHLAASADVPSTEGTRHRGFRVCCEACWGIVDPEGRPRFLFDEDLDREERADGLCIGYVRGEVRS